MAIKLSEQMRILNTAADAASRLGPRALFLEQGLGEGFAVFFGDLRIVLNVLETQEEQLACIKAVFSHAIGKIAEEEGTTRKGQLRHLLKGRDGWLLRIAMQVFRDFENHMKKVPERELKALIDDIGNHHGVERVDAKRLYLRFQQFYAYRFMESSPTLATARKWLEDRYEEVVKAAGNAKTPPGALDNVGVLVGKNRDNQVVKAHLSPFVREALKAQLERDSQFVKSQKEFYGKLGMGEMLEVMFSGENFSPEARGALGFTGILDDVATTPDKGDEYKKLLLRPLFVLTHGLPSIGERYRLAKLPLPEERQRVGRKALSRHDKAVRKILVRDVDNIIGSFR